MRSRQLYYLFLAGIVIWILVSCKKHVEPEPLVPRQYDLPELDEEELDDLPEAGEEEE